MRPLSCKSEFENSNFNIDGFISDGLNGHILRPSCLKTGNQLPQAVLTARSVTPQHNSVTATF